MASRFRILPLGSSIAGRTAFDDISDVNVLAANAHGLDHVIGQLAGTADERLTLQIFVSAGSLADEHEFRARIAHPEYDLLCLPAYAEDSGCNRRCPHESAEELTGWQFSIPRHSWQTRLLLCCEQPLLLVWA